MKINLNKIDHDQFMVNPHIVNGETLWLIQPTYIGVKWTQETKHFRSSLWNDDGELVSAGFPKFTNWGENPEHFPLPQSLKNCNIVEKIDGSLLIVSKYKGHYILRTRGTVDASNLANGHEIEIFEKKYANVFDLYSDDETFDTWPFSLLFEWVSPENRIILNYGNEPEWYLVGGINHKEYTLWGQSFLNETANRLTLKRPVVYSFPSISNLISDVETWKGKEGVCVYSNNDQTIHKVKGAWYLALHRMKEALASFDKVVDVWFEQGQPTYVGFEKFIISNFDWELWTQIRGDSSRICNAASDVDRIVAGMNRFITEQLLPLGDPQNKKARAQMAQQIIASYGKTNRASFLFKLLDNRPLEINDRKKLLYQVMKK